MKKTAVLLINLGTPPSHNVKDVRKYLREFLSDQRVIDLPAILRFILVNCLIAPIRSFKSSKAYKKIWLKNNKSPLLFYSEELRNKLQNTIGNKFEIYLAMRYSKSETKLSIEYNISHIIENNYGKLIILPLYPQYASSSTGTAIEECLKHLKKYNNIPEIKIINNFYQDENYISAKAKIIEDNLLNKKLDHIIFSYHSIPIRQLKKSCNLHSICNQTISCPTQNILNNNFCYRAQCYQATRLLAEKLKLSEEQYSVGFQSRLGKLPWIEPNLESVLEKMRILEYKNIGVVCPSFVSDCLETLEEIAIGLEEKWKHMGGDKLIVSPCLNDNDFWVQNLNKILQSCQT